MVIVQEIFPPCRQGWIIEEGGRAAIDNNSTIKELPTSPEGIEQLNSSHPP